MADDATKPVRLTRHQLHKLYTSQVKLCSNLQQAIVDKQANPSLVITFKDGTILRHLSIPEALQVLNRESGKALGMFDELVRTVKPRNVAAVGPVDPH